MPATERERNNAKLFDKENGFSTYKISVLAQVRDYNNIADVP